MTNYEYESRMSFDIISIDDTARKRILTKKAFDISEKNEKNLRIHQKEINHSSEIAEVTNE